GQSPHATVTCLFWGMPNELKGLQGGRGNRIGGIFVLWAIRSDAGYWMLDSRWVIQNPVSSIRS
ncbi:MAG: hypothetical protein KAV87_60225, partial [Desulfobacteraceae bacterium]|nr:hypothetical protein [Desulfobacteraceae bacterium]